MYSPDDVDVVDAFGLTLRPDNIHLSAPAACELGQELAWRMARLLARSGLLRLPPSMIREYFGVSSSSYSSASSSSSTSQSTSTPLAAAAVPQSAAPQITLSVDTQGETAAAIFERLAVRPYIQLDKLFQEARARANDILDDRAATVASPSSSSSSNSNSNSCVPLPVRAQPQFAVYECKRFQLAYFASRAGTRIRGDGTRLAQAVPKAVPVVAFYDRSPASSASPTAAHADANTVSMGTDSEFPAHHSGSGDKDDAVNDSPAEARGEEEDNAPKRFPVLRTGLRAVNFTYG